MCCPAVALKTGLLLHATQLGSLKADLAHKETLLSAALRDKALAEAALSAQGLAATAALQLAVAQKEAEMKGEMKNEFQLGADFAQKLLGKA